MIHMILGIYQKEFDLGYSKGTCIPIFYCSTIHYSQAMETAKMPHSQQMD
jgi:hypothetical protein